jgi:deazaflavin-dependent oxidoreductase (nitroreductase family)
VNSVPPMEDFNAQIIDEFRSNRGVVGGMFEGMTLLLLHATGAKSGKSRIYPLAYNAKDGRYLIFASKGGAPTNPAWYHNLRANPDARIEVGTETLEVTARELTGAERDQAFREQAQRAPQFADYERNTERTIPVIALTPKQPG